MQALKGRQAALLAIQRDAEQKLAEARNWGNQGRLYMLLYVVYLRLTKLHMLYIAYDWMIDLASRGAQNIPVEIPVEIQNSGRQESGTELSARRNYLRNEFKEQVRIAIDDMFLTCIILLIL